MARVKRAVTARKLKRDYFKAAKGYSGVRRNLWKSVRNAVDKARGYAYRDRRNRKRDFRRLWILRINAAARLEGIRYRDLIHGLKLTNIALDRKALANLALEDPAAFQAICAQVKEKLTA